MSFSFSRGTSSGLRVSTMTLCNPLVLMLLLLLLHDDITPSSSSGMKKKMLVSAQLGTSTCPTETSDIYNTNDHLDLWIGFMTDTFDKCRAGMSSSICTQNEVEEFDLVPTVTFFEDIRGLRGTSEYNGLVTACQTDGYVPVEVDMELFIGTDIRVWAIKRLFCFPSACSTVEEYEEAFYARMGEDTRGYAASGRLDFHPLEEPGTGGGICDPSDAAWTNLSPGLQQAYNAYNQRYSDDCQSTDGFRAEYCNTIYESGGEFDSSIMNFHVNADSSSDYEEFERDCLIENDGEICTVDIIITKQLHVGEELGEGTSNPEDIRLDLNYIYNGLPQCFASGCTYEDKVALSEAVALELYFGLHTDDENEDDARRRSRQLLRQRGGSTKNGSVFLPKSVQKKNLALMTSEREAEIISSIKKNGMQKTKKNVLMVPPRDLEEEEEEEVIGDSNEEFITNSTNQEQEQEQDVYDINVERGFYLELANNFDPSAPYVTKEYPHELFNDKDGDAKKKDARYYGGRGRQRHYQRHQRERRTAFNSFEGSANCGTGIDQCFSRLSNVCLRPIGTGGASTSTNTTTEDEEEVDTNTDVGSGFNFGFGN